MWARAVLPKQDYSAHTQGAQDGFFTEHSCVPNEERLQAFGCRRRSRLQDQLQPCIDILYDISESEVNSKNRKFQK